MSSRHQTWSGWIDAKSSVATPPFASSQRSLAAILLVAGPPGAIALVNRADGGMSRPIDELGLGARRPRGIASDEAQCRDKERASEQVIPDLRHHADNPTAPGLRRRPC